MKYLRQELVQIIVATVKLNQFHPIDYTGSVTETVKELLGEQVCYSTPFAREIIVVLLCSMTNRLDDVRVQVLVLAYEIPEVLADDLQIPSEVARSGFPITDAQNGLNICAAP
jgi:hypothetical protein